MDADLRGSARVSARRPSAGPAERESTEALTRLCAALYPVLRARDVDGFRRVLAAAEDVLGDTSELLAWPEERLRALMADMLREPRRFGLPRWPAPAASPPPPAPPAPPAPAAPVAAATLPLPGFPAPAPDGPGTTARRRGPRRRPPAGVQQLPLW